MAASPGSCLCHCSLAAGLAAPTRSELLLRAMSRPSSVSPRPPAPGGGGPASCGPGGGGRAKGLKDIRIDEEVKIAVNIALERFRYGDQRGEAPDWGPCWLTPAHHPPGPPPRWAEEPRGWARRSRDCWSWAGTPCGSVGLWSSWRASEGGKVKLLPGGKFFLLAGTFLQP